MRKRQVGDKEAGGKRRMRKIFIKYTVPMIVDTAKLANPILWTAG